MSGTEDLLDTNVVIGFLTGNERVVSWLQQREGPFSVSVITRMELLSYPEMQKEEEQYLQAFLGNVQVDMSSEEIEEAAIELRRRHHLRLPDAIIAATATVRGAILVTGDTKLHCCRDSGLRVIDPFAAAE